MNTDQTEDQILLELHNAVIAFQSYPERHPSLKIKLMKSYSLLVDSLATRESISWLIDKRGFFATDEQNAEKQAGIYELAAELSLRHIKKLSFFEGITFEEWLTFLSIFREKQERFSKEDGAGLYLSKKGVNGVSIEDAQYEELQRHAEEIKEDVKEEIPEIEPMGKNLQKETVGVTPDEKDIDQAIDESVKDKEEMEESEKTLVELIEDLDNQDDPCSYRRLAAKILKISNASIIAKEWEQLFPVMEAFFKHSIDENKRTPETRAIAKRCLECLFVDGSILYLIFRLCNKAEEDRSTIQQMLLNTEVRGVQLLLDAISNRREVYARRYIFNTLLMFNNLLKFSNLTREEIEERVGDTRWYVVRQMVALLGEVGDPRSIKALKTAIDNPDLRVKKETIKSLAGIPGRESTEILLKIVNSEEDSLKIQAIVGLGALKDTISITTLGKVALKKETFSQNIESRKEAIKALGLIGSMGAIMFLKRLLKQKVWFGKKEHEDVQILAIMSLGTIGGKEAFKVIKETALNAGEPVRLACEKVLKGHK